LKACDYPCQSHGVDVVLLGRELSEPATKTHIPEFDIEGAHEAKDE